MRTSPSPDPTTAADATAAVFRVRGQVQGVGFRPFVGRLARQFGLAGRVRNDSDGVLIHAEGPAESLVSFRAALLRSAPLSAQIEAIIEASSSLVGYASFEIETSATGRSPAVRVPRDRSTCPSCLADIFEPHNRRFLYPFTNCTDCGPRTTIIEALPYDRVSTTMRPFDLCANCRAEYDDPADRRFHAEPIACPRCGPRVILQDPSGRGRFHGHDAILEAARRIGEGQVVAVLGLGGFQLLARADWSCVVRRLRESKARPTKPLAIMVGSVDDARHLVDLDTEAARCLASPENPIVLLDRIAASSNMISSEVAPGTNSLGVLLPTTPLHHLLLKVFGGPVIATSGNQGDQPIARNLAELNPDLADVVLTHDRPIAQRLDDSVVRVIDGRAVSFRLARGYAPLPLPSIERANEAGPDLPLPPLLATGGHQKVALALWTGRQAILGPHIGDLDGPRARASFVEQVARLTNLYHAPPRAIACDLHPGYFTTAWALEQGLPIVRVQHHHAHAVAAMVEHNLLDQEVLALTWDGTGFGPDGTIWGGEILKVRVDHHERIASLVPFRLPGGEAAIRQPGRLALSLIAQALGQDAVLRDHSLLDSIGLRPAKATLLLNAAGRDVNAPRTSSIGRLFDGVAALILGIQRVSHEAEAAMQLESAADPDPATPYPFPILPAGDGLRLGDWRPMIVAMLGDRAQGVPAANIASRFQESLAHWAGEVVGLQPGSPVVLAGGCFQNRRLTESTLRVLRSRGATVHGPGRIPPGDGGLAAGQLAVAMHQLRAGQNLDSSRHMSS